MYVHYTYKCVAILRTAVTMDVEVGTMPAEERIDIRTSPLVKRTIQRAARLQGVSVSSFVSHHTYEAARRVLERDVLMLNNQDRDLFLSALEDPPEANSALRDLMQKKRNP